MDTPLFERPPVSLQKSQLTDQTDRQLQHWLALLHTPGIGSRSFLKLWRHFENIELVFKSPKRDIERVLGRGLANKSWNFLKKPDYRAVDNDLNWLKQAGNRIICCNSPSYPALLLQISDPPAVLFVQGNVQNLVLPQLGIVGSRNPSHQGKEAAFQFARYLSSCGLAITSGLALGIDTQAHRGAIADNNVTIAVSGCGLDTIYPARNKGLACEIAEHGSLISEYPPGTKPLAQNFPKRNRIISGLSLGILVVEAAVQSGSLITARMAMEQNREVFAIPGSINNPLAKGCHKLIQEGAKLVETAQDIFDEILPTLPYEAFQHVSSQNHSQDKTFDNPIQASMLFDNKNNDMPKNEKCLPNLQTEILEYLGHEARSIDYLIEKSRLTADVVCSMLVELELRGIVVSDGGLYSLQSATRN